MAQYRRGQDERKKLNYVDHGQGTILDGLTSVEDLVTMSSYFLNHKSSCSLRNRLMFLFCHFTLCRGENVRSMQLADLFCLKLDNEGYSDCIALVAVMSQGKTNQFERKEFGSFVRNKKVEICPFGALALYFFQRFHLDRESFPDMSSNRTWFDIYMAPGINPTTPLTYDAHHKFVKMMLHSLGISSRVKTHMGRGSGARMADILSASDSDIRRSGRWNQQAVNCYFTTIPRETIRCLSGFPNERGHYYIERSLIEPNIGLQEKIFPQLNELNNLDVQDGQSIAKFGFLKLMRYIRIVFLQDSVFMSKKYPQLNIWKHELFESAEYKGFAELLEKTCNETEDPAELKLQQSIPLIATHLKKIGSMITSSRACLEKKIDESQKENKKYFRKMSDVFSGKV